MSKTLFRTLLFSGLLTIFLTLTFSFSAQRIAEQLTTDAIYDKNSKALDIITNYIQSSHERIQTVTYQLSSDSSVNVFLIQSSMDSPEAYETMLELRDSLELNPMFHSLCLYSGYTGEYFSTLTSRSGEDEYFRGLIEDPDFSAFLQPYFRTLPGRIYNTSAPVFSYFYFERDNQGQVLKAININLDAERLCSSLNDLKGNGANTYIIDLNNRYVIDGSIQAQTLDDTNLAFTNRILSMDTQQGCFVDDASGEEQLITYQILQSPNWILITVEPNTEIQAAMNTAYRYLFLIMALLIVLGLLFSTFYFRRLYKPWSKLYHQIVTTQAPAASPSRFYDDVEAIQKSIQLTQNQLTDFLRYQNSAQNVLLESYIRALLREDWPYIEKLSAPDRRSFEASLSETTRVAILRVGHWRQIKTSLSGSSEACTYSLMQLSAQIFPSSGPKAAYKWIYLGRGQFLLILFPSYMQDEDMSFQEQLAELQQRFTSSNGLSATVAVGGTAKSIEEFRQASQTAQELLNESVLYERQSILTVPQRDEDSPPPAYDERLEKALLDAIYKEQTMEACVILGEILAKYRQGTRQTFILCLTQLFLNLDKRLHAPGHTLGGGEAFLSFYSILPEAESLDDIQEKFADSLEKLPSREDNTHQKTELLVNSLREYINEHYSEDISLKFLSAKFNFSQGYLGTVFKDSLGLSVYEYINGVRLDAAAQLLVDTSLNALTIMRKCGFINESNFYKLFKARFGVTPKTYREQHTGKSSE